MDSTKLVEILCCWKSPNCVHGSCMFHQLPYIIWSGRKIVTKIQALRGCPGDMGSFFPLLHLLPAPTSPAEQNKGRQNQVSAIPIHSWALWNLNFCFLHCHLNIKFKCQNTPQGKGRISPRYSQISFPYSFWSSERKFCYCFKKYCFCVPVEIHKGNIIFNPYHKQKYLFLVEILSDRNITENII